jgi:uncharacterized protein
LNIEVFLILAGTGIAAGILSGLFGVGGGIVIVPSLIFIYGMLNINSSFIVHTAVATSLFTIIFTSFSSSYKHSRTRNIMWEYALVIGIASAVSVFLISKTAINLPGDILKKIFSVVLILVGLRMLFQKTGNKINGDTIDAARRINYPLVSLTGILSGAIAAFTGLGGGIFIIPLMHYVLKIPIKKAIGTSTAAIFITSIAGVISYIINVPDDFSSVHMYSLGMVDVLFAMPIILASIPSAQLGVLIHNKTPHTIIARIFGAFVIIVSVKMLF